MPFHAWYTWIDDQFKRVKKLHHKAKALRQAKPDDNYEGSNRNQGAATTTTSNAIVSWFTQIFTGENSNNNAARGGGGSTPSDDSSGSELKDNSTFK